MKKLLFGLFFLGTTYAFSEEFVIRDLSGGLYSYMSSNQIPDNACSEIVNFYTDAEPIAIERNGYEKRDSTILKGTSSVLGLWEFVENDGDQWIISYASHTFYKNTIGIAPVQFGPTTTVDQIPDCAVNLGVIMCVNGTDTAWTFNGVSTAAVAGAPLGKLIEPWRTRFIISNITSSQSTVRVCADGDYTNWTLAGLATDPFSFQIGGANDGFNVTCLWKSYLDNFVIGRKKDLWYLSGFDQSDYEVRNVSSELGCLQQGSMREFDGSLLFLSNRGMEELRGFTITHISEPIRNLTDTIVKNTSSDRSITLTSQSDWQTGSISPSGTTSTDISPGSVVLASAAAISAFSDILTADFSTGTLTTVSTSAISDSLILSVSGSTTSRESYEDVLQSGFVSCTDGDYHYQSQSFTSTSTYGLYSISLDLAKEGNPSDQIVQLRSNSTASGSDRPSTILSSGSLSASSLAVSTAMINIVLQSNYPIESGTRYWIVLIPTGTCDSSNRVVWYGDNSPGHPNETLGQGNFHTQTSERNYHNYGKNFATSGNIVSRAFDMGFTTATWIWSWSSLTANGSIPSGTTLSFETQTSSSSSGAWETLASVSTGSAPTSTVKEFIRYKATFGSDGTSGTPRLDDVTITSSERRKPSGGYVTQVVDAGSAITAWGQITIADQKLGGNITYQFNSSTQSSIALFNSSSWTTVVSGQIPTNGALRYFAYRSSFTASVGTASVSLDSIQTAYTEGGSIAPPITSWVYDRRYWLAFTTSTVSSPYNDRILVYQRNRTWSLLQGINAASFATWKDFLYFGNSNSTGYVYKFDAGTSDDGSAISSRLRTKSYDLGQFFREKDFRYMYVNYLGDSAFSGSFTMSYDIDRSGSLYSLGSANLDESVGQNSPRFPFPMSNVLQGREIQYVLTKSGSGDRLKLGSFGTNYQLKEER